VDKAAKPNVLAESVGGTRAGRFGARAAWWFARPTRTGDRIRPASPVV